MSFADNLRAIRKEKNISQDDLAELLNVSRQAVSKWEQGAGFPEMEKMLILSKELGVSLDNLAYGDSSPEESLKRVASATGKILIKSQDGKSIVNCIKILSFPISKKEDEPQYALFGVDGRTFLDERRVFLGWYENEEMITKEINAIWDGMEKGEASYALKHTVRVKEKFLRVKLDR